MSTYECKKGVGHIHILLIALLWNFGIFLLIRLIDIYEIVTLIEVFLVIVDIYLGFNIIFILTMKYSIDDEKIIISGIGNVKKVIIPFQDITSYFISREHISSVKLYGFATKKFAIGRFVVNKIGTTRMFATCNNLIYLKTDKINYAISPKELDLIADIMDRHNIKCEKWEYDYENNCKLHNKKKFIAFIIFISTLIFIFTITPLILFQANLLPNEMPLALSSKFLPLVMGTSKQFVSKQLIYGIINMGILLCMFFAAFSHIKYDEKTAYIYIYISLIIAAVFFFMQIRIIFQYI
jgi:hypothetical protein